MLTQTEKLRILAIKRLGGNCVRCGDTNPLVLDIDHVKGDGHVDRKVNSRYLILKNIIQGKDLERFQLLCASCHRIKTLDERGSLTAKKLKPVTEVLNTTHQNLINRPPKKSCPRDPKKVEEAYERREREYAVFMRKKLKEIEAPETTVTNVNEGEACKIPENFPRR